MPGKRKIGAQEGGLAKEEVGKERDPPPPPPHFYGTAELLGGGRKSAPGSDLRKAERTGMIGKGLPEWCVNGVAASGA